MCCSPCLKHCSALSWLMPLCPSDLSFSWEKLPAVESSPLDITLPLCCRASHPVLVAFPLVCPLHHEHLETWAQHLSQLILSTSLRNVNDESLCAASFPLVMKRGLLILKLEGKELVLCPSLFPSVGDTVWHGRLRLYLCFLGIFCLKQTHQHTRYPENQDPEQPGN